MRANQLRLWLSSLAYVLMEAVRRLALAGTELANATAGTIRLKLLKIGAVVTVSVRRIKLAFASACPTKAIFALAVERLRRLREPPARRRGLTPPAARGPTTEDQRRACPSRQTRQPLRTPTAGNPPPTPYRERRHLKLNAVVRNAG